MNDLSKIILETRDRFIYKGIVANYKEINRGPCVIFSKEIKSIFEGECELLNNNIFLGEEKWDSDGEVFWNKDILIKYGSLPPKEIDCKDLGEKIYGYHQWIYFEGKHYDTECPYGVSNMFDLPFFKYHLEKKSNTNDCLYIPLPKHYRTLQSLFNSLFNVSDFVIQKNILLSFKITLRGLKFRYNESYILVVSFK